MELWQAMVLGVVQGLTEFLPISSSGHLIIFPWLFGWESGGLQFDAALHLGTLVAVVVYFWRDLWNLVRVIPYAATHPQIMFSDRDEPDDRDDWAKLGWLIVIASIPGGLVGLLLKDQIDDFFHADEASNRAIAVVATMLIAVGIVMALAERVGKRTRTQQQANWIDGMLLGLAQALAAIFPGTSRSGATITTGLFRSLKRGDAARISFLAGIPLIAAAGLTAVRDALDAGMTHAEKLNFVAGGASAAIIGFVTIWGLLKFLQRQSTSVFIAYRIAFGLLLLALIAFR